MPRLSFCEEACRISPQRRIRCPDLCGDVETRPGEELDVCVDFRGDTEPREDEGEEPDVRGEDVERRPVAVEKPNAGHDLCDDITMAPATCDAFVTAIE